MNDSWSARQLPDTVSIGSYPKRASARRDFSVGMTERPYCLRRAPRCSPSDPAWRLGFEVYASPFDVLYLKNNSCRARNSELGVSHARLPVSHMNTFSEKRHTPLLSHARPPTHLLSVL